MKIFYFQFDTYTRSLSIDPNSSNFRLVTDGQLPLRQCLHPEACSKEIDLPSYYWKFCDLRKEFVRFKAGDLSKALVPASDASKLNNMPSLPSTPNSIAEMMSGKLSLNSLNWVNIHNIDCLINWALLDLHIKNKCYSTQSLFIHI